MAFVKGLDREETLLLPLAVDEFISEDSPTRAIDAFVDSLDLKSLGFSVRDDFAQGRSSYHPSSLLKLYLWGYLARTRSSRGLEEASESNLNAIWLTGNLRPDHSTISRFRKKQATALAKIFGQFTTVCLELGLYGRELIAIDGTFIKAVNSRTKSYTKAQFKELMEKIDRASEHYLEQLAALDAEEDQSDTGAKREDINAKLESIRKRQTQFDKLLKESEEDEGNKSGQVNLTDPDCRQLRKRGQTTIGYNVQSAVDDKNHLIAACEVTQDGNDLGQLDPMIQKAKENLGLEPDSPIKALADTGYHCGDQLASCQNHNSEVYVPAPNRKTSKVEVFKLGDFIHRPALPGEDPRSDSYICPNGKVLNRRKDSVRSNGQAYQVYGASRTICSDCQRKKSCTKKPARELSVSVHREVIEAAQVRLAADPDTTWIRASLAEHPFGTFKDSTGSQHLLTKGLVSVGAEVNTTFWSYNFKRVMKIIGVQALIEAFDVSKTIAMPV